MELKIGTARFDALPIDPSEEILDSYRGTSTRRQFELAMLRQLHDLTTLSVAQYDCATGVVTSDLLNEQGQFEIGRQMKFVGTNASGKATKKATIAYRDALLAASGYDDMFKMAADLDKRFGVYSAKVPFDKIFAKIGRKKSFRVTALVEWLSFELVPKPNRFPGTMFAAVPYHVSYTVTVFNKCNKSGTKTLIYGEVVTLNGRGLNPVDPDMRDAVRKRLKERVAQYERNLTVLKAKLAQMLEREGAERSKEEEGDLRRRIRETEKLHRRYKKQLNKISND